MEELQEQTYPEILRSKMENVVLTLLELVNPIYLDVYFYSYYNYYYRVLKIWFILILWIPPHPRQ